MATTKVTDETFAQEVLESDKPVLVDFWAEWCGPCKMIAPALEEISEEMSGIVVAKINIDENPDAPTRYGVRSIPTMILFRGGEAIDTKIGAQPKNRIVDWISESVNGG